MAPSIQEKHTCVVEIGLAAEGERVRNFLPPLPHTMLSILLDATNAQ